MLRTNKPSLELLFSQLGLPHSPAAIELYVRTHQLSMDVPLHKAPFWTPSQHDFIISHWKKDDDWAIWIDELNQQLHLDAYKLQAV